MRELKFRVWDKLDKEFAQRIECLLDMSVAERVFALDDDDGKLIIEQYTGHKDKNGKEIYEGDIVKSIFTHRLYQVVYRQWDASFVCENDEWEEILLFISNERPSLEVIGNIHENLELLEEEDA